jgi:hypothetical protein
MLSGENVPRCKRAARTRLRSIQLEKLVRDQVLLQRVEGIRHAHVGDFDVETAGGSTGLKATLNSVQPSAPVMAVARVSMLENSPLLNCRSQRHIGGVRA